MDSANAQEMPGMQVPQATEHHKWLAQLVGSWDGVAEMIMGPDQPPMTSKGAVHYRMLGELWLLGDMETPMDDDAPSCVNMITLGFDPLQDKYVGNFISPMMTMMWIYSGSREGNKLVLDTIGPDMSPGAEPGPDGKPRMVPYQDIFEVVSPDEHTLRSQVKQDDGSWVQFMFCRYTRK
jgi:hypothetical protein